MIIEIIFVSLIGTVLVVFFGGVIILVIKEKLEFKKNLEKYKKKLEKIKEKIRYWNAGNY
jgi:hypothetical protein